MAYLITVIAYLLGSIPTAYIAGRLVKNKDIRTLGDGNMGAQNAFRQFGPRIGFSVGVLDAAKGALAIIIYILIFSHNLTSDLLVNSTL